MLSNLNGFPLYLVMPLSIGNYLPTFYIVLCFEVSIYRGSKLWPTCICALNITCFLTTHFSTSLNFFFYTLYNHDEVIYDLHHILFNCLFLTSNRKLFFLSLFSWLFLPWHPTSSQFPLLVRYIFHYFIHPWSWFSYLSFIFISVVNISVFVFVLLLLLLFICLFILFIAVL